MNVPVAAPVASVAEKGLKRICPSCGTRYYDLNKRPVNCPSCATEFTGELKVKTRRGRVAALPDDDTNGPATASKKGANGDSDDDAEVVESEVDTVSLEDVEAAEEAEAGEEAEADLDIDDDLVDDDELDDEELVVEDEEKA
jgi:uncharacterized protein (TIGR02300 family)